MNIEMFNYFYRANIEKYEMFLSEIKSANNRFVQQEKALKVVYYSPAHLVNSNKIYFCDSQHFNRYFFNVQTYFQSLKMIEYFGIDDNNPIPKCDLKALMLSENISKNTKGRMRHFYDILCRIHNEFERFKSFKFDVNPESLF